MSKQEDNEIESIMSRSAQRLREERQRLAAVEADIVKTVGVQLDMARTYFTEEGTFKMWITAMKTWVDKEHALAHPTPTADQESA